MRDPNEPIWPKAYVDNPLKAYTIEQLQYEIAFRSVDETSAESMGAQLASARKALEAVKFDQERIGNCAPDTLDLVIAALKEISK